MIWFVIIWWGKLVSVVGMILITINYMIEQTKAFSDVHKLQTFNLELWDFWPFRVRDEVTWKYHLHKNHKVNRCAHWSVTGDQNIRLHLFTLVKLSHITKMPSVPHSLATTSTQCLTDKWINFKNKIPFVIVPWKSIAFLLKILWICWHHENRDSRNRHALKRASSFSLSLVLMHTRKQWRKNRLFKNIYQ